MSKIFTGRDGSLLLSGQALAKVSNWTLQGELETLETTTLGDSQRTYTPGIQGFNGSASLLYYKSDAGVNDAGTLLRKIIKTDGVSTSDIVSLTLRLSDGATTNDVTINAYITSVSIGATVGDVSRAEISFQVTGAPTTVTI